MPPELREAKEFVQEAESYQRFTILTLGPLLTWRPAKPLSNHNNHPPGPRFLMPTRKTDSQLNIRDEHT